MTEDDYIKRRERVFTTPQFVKSSTLLSGTTKNPITIKIEKFKNRLKQLGRKGSIDKDYYNKVCSTVAQPARLSALTKVYKKDTPFCPVLSLPGSCYEPLTNSLVEWLEKLPEAQIETFSSKIEDELVSATLDDDDLLKSLDVNLLYTNVPVEESISMAAALVYARITTPDFKGNIYWAHVLSSQKRRHTLWWHLVQPNRQNSDGVKTCCLPCKPLDESFKM